MSLPPIGVGERASARAPRNFEKCGDRGGVIARSTGANLAATTMAAMTRGPMTRGALTKAPMTMGPTRMAAMTMRTRQSGSTA